MYVRRKAGRTTMIKKLTKHGNSMALVIDKPLLEILHIEQDTPLEVATDGDVLVVTPVRDKARQKKLERALEKVNKKYGRALKRLAE